MECWHMWLEIRVVDESLVGWSWKFDNCWKWNNNKLLAINGDGEENFSCLFIVPFFGVCVYVCFVSY